MREDLLESVAVESEQARAVGGDPELGSADCHLNQRGWGQIDADVELAGGRAIEVEGRKAAGSAEIEFAVVERGVGELSGGGHGFESGRGGAVQRDDADFELAFARDCGGGFV